MRQVNYAQIEQTLDRLEEQLQPRLCRIFREAATKLEQVIASRVREKGLDAKFIDAVEVRGLGGVTPVLRTYLQATFLAGQRIAQAELGTPPIERRHTALGVWRAVDGVWVEDVPFRAYADPQPVANVFLGEDTVPPAEVVDYFDKKAFLWKGIMDDELRAAIKRVLLGSWTNGEPMRETVQALERTFAPYIGNLAKLPDQEQVQPYRLQTLIRTNSTEAFNRGRVNAYKDQAGKWVTAFEYSAILDTRTTPVCRFLHGKLLPPSGETLTRLVPPRHHNCRSLVSPVTRAENARPMLINQRDFDKAVELSGEGF